MSDKVNKTAEDDEWNELPLFMTRGGPGDHNFKTSKLGGKVDTSEWFSSSHVLNPAGQNYNEDLLKANICNKYDVFFILKSH